MRKKKVRAIFLILSMICILVAIGLTWWQYRLFNQRECVFPADFEIESIPVEGLTPDEAIQRIKVVYSSPVTVEVDQLSFQVDPESAGVTYDWNAVIEEGIKSCEMGTSVQKFWEYVWNQQESVFNPISLPVKVDEKVLSDWIANEILPRYIQKTSPSYPIPGTTQFALGSPGSALDALELQEKIVSAFQSRSAQIVSVNLETQSAPVPTMDQIEFLLQDNIRTSEFSGLIEIYVQDLTTGEELQFATLAGEEIQPGIAFTAASTMKIPIMVSTLWREDVPLDETVSGWLNFMIVLSENDPADRLMERIDQVSGPLLVTAEMQSLGLENTFISGYFYLGAPLLSINNTPANSRTDVFTNPDLYNQTTTADIGNLLAAIYFCAQSNQGLLVEKSQGKFNSEKCQVMVDILSRNQIGALVEAGLPEGTQISHKHGWSEESDGLLHTVSDVAIVYGPEKNYVFTIFVYSPGQLLFEDANYLVALLAQTAYNGLNPNHQIPWLFGR